MKVQVSSGSGGGGFSWLSRDSFRTYSQERVGLFLHPWPSCGRQQRRREVAVLAGSVDNGRALVGGGCCDLSRQGVRFPIAPAAAADDGRAVRDVAIRWPAEVGRKPQIVAPWALMGGRTASGPAESDPQPTLRQQKTRLSTTASTLLFSWPVSLALIQLARRISEVPNRQT